MKKSLCLIFLCMVFKLSLEAKSYQEIILSEQQLKHMGLHVLRLDKEIFSKGLPFNAYIDFDSKSSVVQSLSFDASVVAVYKREGEQVKKGDMICEVSSISLSNLYFELQNNRNKLKIATDVTKKDLELYKAGVISQREYQTSFLASEEMRLKVEQLETTFKGFGIDPKKPKGDYGFRIVARDSGLLSVAPKNAGEKILAFTSYVRISKSSNLIARIKLPVDVSRHIKQGSLIYSSDGMWIGEIQSVSVVLDRGSNTILATALISEKSYHVGEMVEVYIQGSQPKDSVLVPSKALIRDGKNYLAFIRTSKGFRPIIAHVLEERNKTFVVSSDSLKPSDSVATGALIGLKGMINHLGEE
ncbi:cobalt-zinc-cadmium resistance protein, CzcB family [Helicobacter cetorum MIT 00-7128]|uniref:Cobalt-zinc-cadmium resistance protein, CzcB family n=2 Tax=Helicobacter cetorum TaxID=138563 RepID=I0EN03_HELC0|nr:sodium:proton antiporter [Helicobacter cetorum]AFI04322.1 cobalt-zinc-cadmium resistance protein, CzcB family [Helicobacter cetorum MIT 00-7128]